MLVYSVRYLRIVELRILSRALDALYCRILQQLQGVADI